MSEKFCGIDVHRDTLVATVLDGQTEEKQTRKFKNHQDEITQLKDWLKQNHCLKVTMESTSIFWVVLYLALEDSGFLVTLANAYRVKAIPGRKTDQLDSEWLAYLLRAKLIKPSYVPPKVIRELRELTRLRTKYVQNQTQFKNRCQGLLRRVDICLGSRLSDVFGKAGSEILRGLASGKSVEAILAETKNGWLAEREEEILAVAKGSLSENDMFILQELTESILHLEQKIVEVSARIELRVNEHNLAIVASVPGVGKGSAASILAEIGDASRFSSGKQIAAWAGLVPSVHQSAGVTVLGRITKRGSKWLRRDMIAVAHCAVNVRGSVFRDMFLRVSARHGANTAYTAVARKMLTVIWHLLVCDELYVEEGVSKKPVKLRREEVVELSLEEMVGILRNAGYSVGCSSAKG